MRYDIRFRNGVWTIFDLHAYKACEAFATYKLAKAKFDAPVRRAA